MSALFELAADYGSDEEEEEEELVENESIELRKQLTLPYQSPSPSNQLNQNLLLTPTPVLITELGHHNIERSRGESLHFEEAEVKEFLASPPAKTVPETSSRPEDFPFLKSLPSPSEEAPSDHVRQLLLQYESGNSNLSNIVDNIINDKSFGNPSFLTKVSEYFHIDQSGSNYPVDMFNPKSIDLAAFQKYLNDESTEQPSTSSKFSSQPPPTSTGTATSHSQTGHNDGNDRPKKKSKWDLH